MKGHEVHELKVKVHEDADKNEIQIVSLGKKSESKDMKK